MKPISSLLTAALAGVLAACNINVQYAPNLSQDKVELRPSVDNNNRLSFDVYYNNGSEHHMLNIKSLGISFSDSLGLSLGYDHFDGLRTAEESYQMVAGKKTDCHNVYTEGVYHLLDQAGRDVRVRTRVYHDGIAFRYEVDSLNGQTLKAENTIYSIPEGTKRWMQKWTEPYEEFFPLSSTGAAQDHHWGYPALAEPTEGTKLLITEADIHRQHSASSLYNDQDSTEYRVVPAENTAELSGTWCSPWRVVIVGDEATLIESTLVTDLSAPCQLEDTSWIKPGSVSWIYWAYNHGSNDYQIVRKYIDMAHTLKLPYVLIDAEWDEMSNGGTIEDLFRYAKEQGVRVLIWYNSSTAWIKEWGAPGPHNRLNKAEDREREFAWLEEMGVAGVKIDFFAGDKQETMNYCIDLLECAARHHLTVNFHGATLPRGWQRTYPNLVSTEAVYGAEWYNNVPTFTTKAAAHNATLPFTRNVVGSMDYTPCAFSDSQHPHITTHAHELALSVLFESAMQHWADKPESYMAQPQEVLDFMTALPTVWDETRYVSGYPAEDVTLARRKGNTWYVAGINGRDTLATLQLNWDFVGSDSLSLQLFKDSGNTSEPWDISSAEAAKASLPASIDCQPRGGFVMILKQK